MVVYEATKRKDYMKIANFIASQSKDNPCFASWTVGHPTSTAGFIEHCKQTRENYLIFWCEDETKKIRSVHAIEIHPTGFGSSIATKVFALNDNEDMTKNNMKYYSEIIAGMYEATRDKYTLKRGEFWVAEHLVEWTKAVFEGCYEIMREADFMGKKIYFMIVDFSKYLETH